MNGISYLISSAGRRRFDRQFILEWRLPTAEELIGLFTRHLQVQVLFRAPRTRFGSPPSESPSSPYNSFHTSRISLCYRRDALSSAGNNPRHVQARRRRAPEWTSRKSQRASKKQARLRRDQFPSLNAASH